MSEVVNDYANDRVARYLVMRVYEYEQNNAAGIPYEIAITSTKTTKEAIDYWMNCFKIQYSSL